MNIFICLFISRGHLVFLGLLEIKKTLYTSYCLSKICLTIFRFLKIHFYQSENRNFEVNVTSDNRTGLNAS